MKHKRFSLILLICILVSCFSPACAVSSVGVTIDGTPIAFTKDSGSPFIDSNSRTLVPLRIVMEQYGCTVGWDKDTYTASVTMDNTAVLVPIGKKQIQINDTAIAIDAAAQIKDGRTYLPIRAVLEAFGAAVGWDTATRTVTVLHPENTGLRIHFLDVGQADCTLITVGSEAMLIDAGNNDDAEAIVAYLRAHGATNLKYAVGTHPHEDHIGSLDTVLHNFSVQTLLMPQIQTNTKTFEDVLDAAIAKKLSITAPNAGDVFTLGKAQITIVSNYFGDDLNNSSIMLRLVYGNTSFLFTGDAEGDGEIGAMQTGLTLDSDVLKAGHHGSSTSSSAEFLAAVSPAYTVISCGANNDYGHPHEETLTALTSIGSIVCRTDTMGTLLAVSDGVTTMWSNTAIPTLVKNPPIEQTPTVHPSVAISYILNTNTKKFHLPSCRSVSKISAENREDSTADRNALMAAGYAPCGSCKP